MAKFTRARESADLDALVALLTGDVFIAMPPIPFGYEGQDAVTRYCASLFAAGRRFDLVPVRANGQRRARAVVLVQQPCVSCQRVRVRVSSGLPCKGRS